MGRPVAALATVILGVWIGVNIADPPTEYVTEEKVVTKTERVPVEVPASLPADCLAAIDYAKQLAEASVIIDDASYLQLDIISDGRAALIARSTNQLNKLETRQRDMEQDTLAAVAKIAEIKPYYDQTTASCQEELNQ